jgi:hypothetical protein
LGPLSAKEKKAACMHLLKANAKLVEISFGVDKKNCIILRNAIPVIGISYDAFSCTYEAHISGIKFFHDKMKPMIVPE